MKKILLSVFLYSLLNAAHALPPRGSEEYKTFFTWNENHKLKWSDFQAVPVPNSSESAMTASSVEFSYFTRGNQVSWEVTAKYFPKLSWSKRSDQSDYILQHEQGHFDITELYARMFRKQLAENIRSAKDVPKMSAISREILKDWDKEESAYDKETRHSLDSTRQKEWLTKLQQRLDALKDFASK